MSSPSSTPAGRLPLLRRRRRAEEFARLLDGDPGAVAMQTDPHLAPLVDLAAALRSVPLGPTPDFRAVLRQRLVAVAAVQGGGEVSLPAAVRDTSAAPGIKAVPGRINEWAEGWRVRNRVIAATAAASAVVLVGGVGLAGSRSLPGQPFYGIKRGVERVQLAAAGSTEAKGERHLEFAQTRLHEVAELVNSPQAVGTGPGRQQTMIAGAPAFGGSLSSRVISTLRDMDSETKAGSKDLTTAFAHSHDAHPLQVLATFAATQQTKLTAVMPALPTAAEPQAAQSLALIKRVSIRASALLTPASCSAACGPNAPVPAPGLSPAPNGGDDLGTTPCTCARSNGSGSGSNQPGGQPVPAPSPSTTPKPGDNGQQNPPAPSTSQPPGLPGPIGPIISELPLPLPTLPVPLPTLPTIPLPSLPVPVPTIQLP
jgi:hypothetical protein